MSSRAVLSQSWQAILASWVILSQPWQAELFYHNPDIIRADDRTSSRRSGHTENLSKQKSFHHCKKKCYKTFIHTKKNMILFSFFYTHFLQKKIMILYFNFIFLYSFFTKKNNNSFFFFIFYTVLAVLLAHERDFF